MQFPESILAEYIMLWKNYMKISKGKTISSYLQLM